MAKRNRIQRCCRTGIWNGHLSRLVNVTILLSKTPFKTNQDTANNTSLITTTTKQ